MKHSYCGFEGYFFMCKICTKCKIEKELGLFGNCKIYGKKHRCKECKRKEYNDNKEYILLKQRVYVSENREKRNAQKREHYYLNKDRLNSISRQYRQKHKEALSIRNKLYREKNKDIIKAHLKYKYQDRFEKRKIYIEKNKEYLNKKNMEWYYNNRERAIKSRIDSLKKRMEKNPLVRLRIIIRRRIAVALKYAKISKKTSSVILLGCTIEETRIHIESQFKEGMTWNNHGHYGGKWHIDHIVPLARAKTEEELLKLFHYTNLQPLWDIENLKKNKY